MTADESVALTDLRAVDRADVYKAGRLTGALQRDGDDVTFAYLPEYLRDGGPPIASTWPLTASRVTAGAGAVPPFFAGLLPEGVRLQAVVTGTKTSIDDHLTLLMALGTDMIGDVQIVPSGVALTEPVMALMDTDIAQADLTEVFVRATSADPEQLERVPTWRSGEGLGGDDLDAGEQHHRSGHPDVESGRSTATPGQRELFSGDGAGHRVANPST
jgi:HipA-like protein